jgi:Fe-S-cluster-containing hydrogenase component 2
MSILINSKICDDAEECDGSAACPTGALFWNKDDKKLEIDDSKCNNCGLCVKACLVGAIKLATNEEEYKKYKKKWKKILG